MEENHFVVKAEGKQKVDVYFAQSAPLTSCVAKITTRDGEVVKHRVVAHGETIHNPKDKWDELVGKRKAFGKMKENLPFPIQLVENTSFVFNGIEFNVVGSVEHEDGRKEKPLPTERDFERAFYEWMKEQSNG